jgi:hypothetical protein
VRWLLLSVWAFANSIADQPAALKHVRSAEPLLRSAIADGYVRSAAFRALVDEVERLPCVLYIGSIVKLSGGMRGALSHRQVGETATPVLRVLLKTNLSHDETIAVIGHELQHVIEVVGGTPPGDRLNWTAGVDRSDLIRLGTTGIRKYETALAVAVTARVAAELKRSPRGSPQTRSVTP